MRVITIDPEGAVGLAVAAAVEPPARDLPRRRLHRRRAAEVRPRRFGAEPFGVVAGRDQQQRGGAGPNAIDRQQLRRGLRGERRDLLVEETLLFLECEDPPAQSPQGGLGREDHRVAPGPRA